MSNHLSASFNFEIAESASEFWHDDLVSVLPRRYQSGNAGALALYTYSMFAQTIEQLYRDVLVQKALKYNSNADSSLLGLIGEENGMFQYNEESDTAFRNRILNRWQLFRTFGTPSSVTDQLNNASFASASIAYDLVGSDEDRQPVKGGSKYIIPAYSASGDHWAQFNVLLDITDKIPSSGTLSNILSDQLLSDARQIVSKYKDIQWICREIVLISGSGDYWGDDSLTYGSFTYSDAGTVERHKGKI